MSSLRLLSEARAKLIAHRVFWVLILVAMTPIATPTLAYEVDTTRVRPEPPPEEPGFGDYILAVPQAMLDLPVVALEGFGKLAVNQVLLWDPVRQLYVKQSDSSGWWSFMPVVGYSANEGWTGGLSFSSTRVFTRNEYLALEASYSTNDYQRYFFRYEGPIRKGILHRAHVQFTYDRRPRESYYGPGSLSKKGNEVAFTLESEIISAGLHFAPHRHLDAHVDVAYSIFNLFDGRDPGVTGNLNRIRGTFDLTSADLASQEFWSAGLALTHDWRNHPGHTTAGGYESLQMIYHRGAGGSDKLEFVRTRLDFWRFLELFLERHVALRLLVEDIITFNDSPPVPVYLLSSLGGEDALHGYLTRRFVDKDLALVAIEYRYPVWRVLDGFVFVEQGRVFHDIVNDFEWRNWRWTVGAGLRAWHSKGIAFDARVAFSEEGTELYLEFTEDL